MLDQKNLEAVPQNTVGSTVSSETNIPLKIIKELFKNSIALTWLKKWRFIFLNIIPKLIGFLPFLFLGVIYAILVFQVGFSKSLISISLVAGFLAIFCLLFLISCVFWSQNAYINYLQTNEESKKTILKNSRKKVWKFFWVSILSGFMAFGYLILFFIVAPLFYIFVSTATIGLVIGGIVFLVLLIHGIIRAIKFSLAPLAYLIDDKTGMLAIKHSEFLTSGYRWAIFKRSLVFGYFQFVIQVLVGVLVVLVGLLLGLGGLIGILGTILIIVLSFINIFIGLLLEPLGYVYNFDIYNNLKLNKQTGESKEKYSLGQKIVVLLLMIVLPIMAIGFSLLLNLISPEKDNLDNNIFSSFVNQIAPGTMENSANILINFEEDDLNTVSDQQQQANDELLKTLNSLTEAETVTANNLFVKTYRSMMNGENIPEFSETEFQFLIIMQGLDATPINNLSLEKKKFIWNIFYVDGLKEQNEQIDLNDDINQNVVQDNINQDVDQDGLTDDWEKYYKTDVNNPDTDGDGYFDGDEVQNGYDPALPGDAKLK
ncbi:MAG TPA: hypothetical protein PLK76_01070 [bacterium]|nr:hypothetical protein [bacterium]